MRFADNRARRPKIFAAVFCLALVPTLHCLSYSFDSGAGQTASAPGVENAALDREVRADMTFLAADELHGRGSATRDEHIAALFAAAQFQTLGLAPGGDDNTFVQRIALPSPLPSSIQRRIAKSENTPRTETWNAIGILRGSDPAGEVVLLTAHLDQIGRAHV